MPSHRAHAYVDRLFFGKAYWKVHRKMDEPYKYFKRNHRIFWHDPVTASAIAASCYPGDRNAISAALLHIETDNMCSCNPLFRQTLELLAERESKKMKNSRRKKNGYLAVLPELKEVLEFCKEMDEIRKLTSLIFSQIR